MNRRKLLGSVIALLIPSTTIAKISTHKPMEARWRTVLKHFLENGVVLRLAKEKDKIQSLLVLNEDDWNTGLSYDFRSGVRHISLVKWDIWNEKESFVEANEKSLISLVESVRLKSSDSDLDLVLRVRENMQKSSPERIRYIRY